MKNRFIHLIIAGVTATAIGLSGCSNRLLQEADRHYSNFEYSVAATQYESYLRTDSSATAMLKLADCYRHMNRHEDAVKWYSKAVNTTEATPVDVLHYAQELRAVGNNDAAKTWYDSYLTKSPADSLAINQRAACDVTDLADPFYDVNVTPIEVNSSCFSPFLYQGTLYYSAEAPKKTGQPVNYWTGNGYLDLYSADPSDISHARTLDSTINTDLHESNIVFADNGNVAYFTRSSLKEIKTKRKTSFEVSSAKDHTNHLEICSAQLINGKWVNVKSISINDPEFSNGHPALISNGMRMYFTSDRPGGFGGTDIYYSDFANETWSAPVNAGANINTAGNEMFPTIRSTTDHEYLYFSSDGWMGAGGMDMYRSEIAANSPVKPQRLPAPFNSKGDDFGITFADDNRTGYFSSNRDNANGDDRIYMFTRKDPRFFMNLFVIDKETTLPVRNTEVEITNVNTMSSWKVNTDSTGHVIFPADSLTTYGFKLMCDQYFCGFNSASTGAFRGSFYDTTYATASIERIVIDKAIRLENIYYDYNKWNIRPDAAIELDKLVKILLDNPKIKIELSSHTDARGSDKYNQTLSQKRAQSAVDYIVSKGISKDRITAKGYGETKPLNKCTNGVKCTEDEHQWNRRTEFKVTEIGK